MAFALHPHCNNNNTNNSGNCAVRQKKKKHLCGLERLQLIRSVNDDGPVVMVLLFPMINEIDIKLILRVLLMIMAEIKSKHRLRKLFSYFSALALIDIEREREKRRDLL